jgi:hypothetical protein
MAEKAVFKRMRKWPVPHIMQEYGYGNGPGFLRIDGVTFGADDLNGLAHQVHGSYGMLESGVVGTRINKVSEPQLPDPPQPLEKGMLDEVVNQIKGDFYKSVNGIIDDFQLVGKRILPHLGPLWH